MQEQLGHYRVLERIGSGGMGVVYRARDERLERDVALKVLSADSIADDDVRRRFRKEALALSRLNHPNIATLHDFTTLDGVDMIVMEHIPGQGLDELVEQGPLAERDILRLGRQLVTALEAAHERGVVHRDLKPGNVRVTPDGRVKVLDFGLARAFQVESEATTESAIGGAFAGTLPYMAPEQIRGEAADARTDIYAAGAVLYEMATGKRVHGELSGTRLLGAILDTPAGGARERNTRISADLERVIAKALDKDPQLRYQSARELGVDLDRLAGDRTMPRRAAHHLARVPRGLVASLVAATVLLTGWMVYQRWPRPVTVQPRGSIVLADFENHSGDEGLADAIRAGLSVQLQQSSYGNVLSREQIFDALRRMQKADRRLDADTGRELCVRENVPILLAGAIQRRGDVTRVDARGVAPASGDVMFAESVEFRNENEAFDSIDALARAVRRQLGESTTVIEQRSKPLARVTTKSLTALKQYSRASDEFAQGNTAAALPYLRAALDVDPDFAMAHRLIARVYETLGNSEQEREHLNRAYELRASLTDREMRHVEASYHRGVRQYDKAVETLSALTALYPGDGEAHYELALAYRDNQSPSKAIQELETTIAQSPYVTVAYGELALLLARSSSYERAAEVLAEAQRRGIEGARLTWARGMVLLGQGRAEEARAQFTHLEADDVYGNIARLYQATTDIFEGRIARAADRLERDLLSDRLAKNTAAELTRRYLLAVVADLQQNTANARKHLTSILEAKPEDLDAETLRRVTTLLARMGDLPRARTVLARLASVAHQSDGAFSQSCLHSGEGAVALAEGQPARAIAVFRASEAEYARPATVQGLARAFAATGDWARARDEWTRVIALRGELLQLGSSADWVLAHLERARAEQHLGDLAAAARDYDTFLNLWSAGDDIPARRAATAEARVVRASAARAPGTRN